MELLTTTELSSIRKWLRPTRMGSPWAAQRWHQVSFQAPSLIRWAICLLRDPLMAAYLEA